MATVVRKSLPLTVQDLSKLEDIKRSPQQIAALSELSQNQLDTSAAEAQLLRAIYLAGLRALEEHVMDAGYAAIAVDLEISADEFEDHRKHVARRRQPDWANE